MNNEGFNRKCSLDFAFENDFVIKSLTKTLKERSENNQNSPVIRFLRFLGHEAKVKNDIPSSIIPPVFNLLIK